MTTKAEAALELFNSVMGEEEGVGEWFEVDQDRINLFADATLDHQFIHIDPKKSAELSPYKVTIAHGFLTLSLIVHLGATIAPKNPRRLKAFTWGLIMALIKYVSPVLCRSTQKLERGIV